MAVITSVNSASTQGASGNTSLDVPIGDNDDGDIIVIAWQRQSNASTQPTVTGFSNAASGVSGFAASGFVYKVNSGGTTTSPVNVSWGATNHICAQSYVIKGQHASPIGANASSGSSSAATLAATTTTTTATNSLILHSVGLRRDSPMQPTLGVFQALAASRSGAQECSGTSGSAYVAASGATTPSFTWGAAAAAACNDVVLEIKSASGSVPIGMTPGRTVLAQNLGSTTFGTSNTWKDPDAVLNAGAIATIDTVSMGTQTPTVGVGTMTGDTFHTLVLTTASTATSAWEGGFETIATTDLTDKIICIPWQRSRSSSDRVGNRGCIVVLVDTADNWVAYTLRTVQDGWAAVTQYVKFIKHGVTTALATGGAGTFDISIVNHIGYFWEGTTATSSGTCAFSIGIIWCEDSPTIFTGGSAERPLSIEYIARHMQGGNQWPKIGAIQGTKQYLPTISHQIGDGSTVTTFDSTGQSFVFRKVDIDYAIGSGDVGLTIKASDSDSINFSASTIAGETLQNFTIHSASSTISSVYNLISASFINLNWTTDVVIDYSGASFSQCNLVELGGGDVSNVTASNPKGSYVAAVSVSGGAISTSSFDVTRAGTDAAYHLELGTSVTEITLADVTFTGTPVSDKVHVLATTGTVTITISGSTSLVAGDVTSAGAAVVISAPTLNQSVALTGLSTTCRVQLYDTALSSELYNAEPGTTSFTWIDSVAAVSPRPIRLRITDYLGATAKVMVERNIGTCGITEGTEAISFNNEFEEDTKYNAQAAALGYSGADILDIEIDDTTDTVKFSFTAGGDYDARRIYMYMVYWLDTEAGIRDDFAFCSPLDPVNLPMEGVLFENVTSPQEIITFINAYVYDSVTGRAKDLVVGDGINFAPDHVVQVIATVSGVNTITGTIDDVAAKVQEGLTAQGLTTTRAAKLDNMDQKVSRVLISTIATR